MIYEFKFNLVENACTWDLDFHIMFLQLILLKAKTFDMKHGVNRDLDCLKFPSRVNVFSNGGALLHKRS